VDADVIATPTTTIAILRGQTTNEFTDVVDTPQVWKAGVPASIIERSQRVHGPKDSEDRIVRIFKLRVPRGTGLQKDDRVRDANGVIYIVDNVYEQSNPFWSQDQSADLSLTS
jgi:hypothetical protein